MNDFMAVFSVNKISKTMFLLIGFVLLVTPVLKINKNDISLKENRRLAIYKNIYNAQDKAFNFDYGTDLDTYIKDRFLGREQMMHISASLRLYLANRYAFYSSTSIDKEKKFMYSKLLPDLVSNERQKEIENQLRLFETYCRERNIKFYTMIIPSKESIYVPDIVRNNLRDEMHKRVKNINLKDEFNFIYPLDEFIKTKSNSDYFLYYSTDSHLTLDGTFLTYNILMHEIKKDFPWLKISESKEFNTYQNNKVLAEMDREFTLGKDCDLAYLSDNQCISFLDINYQYYKHKNYKEIERIRENSDYYRRKIFHYNYGNNERILVFGDSSSENLMDILPYSFKHTEQIRLNGPRKIPDRHEKFKILKYYKKEIENFKPDIIVIYIGYGNLGYLKDIAKEE